MEKRKLKAGDKVWVQKLRRINNDTEPIFIAHIEKVGRKFFTVDKCFRYKFEINTGKEVSEFTDTYRIWFSVNEWTKYIDEFKTKQFVSDFFKLGSFANLSLDQIKRIKVILCEKSSIKSCSG
jgi:hypothetical protein